MQLTEEQKELCRRLREDIDVHDADAIAAADLIEALAAQPQPMTQKDAARDAKRWREKIIRAMRAPSRGDFAIEINAIVREMTDAIERLDRAKGE